MYRGRPSASRWTLLVVLALATSLWERSAHAEHHTAFEYSAPHAGCPTREQATALIVAKLGFDPFGTADAPNSPTLNLSVKASGNGLLARVERLEDGELIGERVLTAPRGECAELVASAAFAASILIDPTGELRARVEARAEPPAAKTEPRVERIVPEAPPLPPTESDPIRPLLGTYVAGNVGAAPSPSFSIALTGGIAFRRWSLRLEGRADLPAETEHVPARTAASVSLLFASLVPCYAARIARLCLVAGMGTMRAETVDDGPIERDSSLVAAVGPRIGVEIPLGSTLRLTSHLEGLVSLRRLTVRTRGNDVWTAPFAAGSLAVGALALFP
jgi:hypothetical protein